MHLLNRLCLVISNRGLYAQGQSWLEREDIVGVARAYVFILVIVPAVHFMKPRHKLTVYLSYGRMCVF